MKEVFNTEDMKLLNYALSNGSPALRELTKRQILAECLFGVSDERDITDIYSAVLNTYSEKEMTLALYFPETDAAREKLEKYYSDMRGVFVFGKKSNEPVCVVIKDYAEDKADAVECAGQIGNISAVYERNVELCSLRKEYEALKQRSEALFYMEKPCVVSKNELCITGTEKKISPPYAEIEHSVLNGDLKKTVSLINSVFEELERNTPCPWKARMICTELYMCIMRCGGENFIGKYTGDIERIQTESRLWDIKQCIVERVEEITKSNTPKNSKLYSSLINDTVSIIDDNLGNENLSLRWIAGTVLYTNVDYLGKLFKKETGKNFSHYVMEKRMEMAKELIVGGKKDKIYEVAEKVGYGSNSQYFSQVFKKYTGVSPLEYKEYARISARNEI